MNKYRYRYENTMKIHKQIRIHVYSTDCTCVDTYRIQNTNAESKNKNKNTRIIQQSFHLRIRPMRSRRCPVPMPLPACTSQCAHTYSLVAGLSALSSTHLPDAFPQVPRSHAPFLLRFPMPPAGSLVAGLCWPSHPMLMNTKN